MTFREALQTLQWGYDWIELEIPNQDAPLSLETGAALLSPHKMAGSCIHSSFQT